MLETNHTVAKFDRDRIWNKYCGFLDVSIEQFMAIQEALLLNQFTNLANCQLSQKIIGKKMPCSVEEFRNKVPLTTYDDYIPELNAGNENTLPEFPQYWAQTSGGTEIPRRVPITQQAFQSSLYNLMAAFILSCSKERGHTSLLENDRVLYNVAPEPYLSGFLASGASTLFDLRPVVAPNVYSGMDFKEKITRGFNESLKTGVDIMVAMTSVLVKMGNDFGNISNGDSISKHFSDPRELYRVSRAFVNSKIENRRILPKDLWPLKSLICWGIDTRIYREQVRKDWGHYPYEFHACTEAGIIAVQSWTRKDLTFIPTSNFFEFIPEGEWLKSKNNKSYEPKTVLLSEVQAGENYELVITSFHGMPFIRYRLGHLVKITSLNDPEAGINLPQMVFEARADELLDIAGFTRISEKTIAGALADSEIRFEDWTIRKEIINGATTLHLYIELNPYQRKQGLAEVLQANLMEADKWYGDLITMMEIQPLQVTVLPPGTFQEYYHRKKEEGMDLSERKPSRINPSDTTIQELLDCTQGDLLEVIA